MNELKTIQRAISKAGSGRALAARIGVSSGTVNLWSQGKTVPSAIHAAAVADFLEEPLAAYEIGREMAKIRELA